MAWHVQAPSCSKLVAALNLKVWVYTVLHVTKNRYCTATVHSLGYQSEPQSVNCEESTSQQVFSSTTRPDTLYRDRYPYEDYILYEYTH